VRRGPLDRNAVDSSGYVQRPDASVAQGEGAGVDCGRAPLVAHAGGTRGPGRCRRRVLEPWAPMAERRRLRSWPPRAGWWFCSLIAGAAWSGT